MKESSSSSMNKCCDTFLDVCGIEETIVWLATHIGGLQDKVKALEKKVKKLEKESK